MSNLPVGTPGGEKPILKAIRNKWVQSGIAGIPFVGSSVQVILANVVKTLDDERWSRFWESVEARLSALEEEKVSIDYFSSEDFVNRVRAIYEEVILTRDAVRLQYLRDYFVACASSLETDIEWKDLFLRYLREMSGTHLLILRAFYDRQSSLSYKDRFELPQRMSDAPLCMEDLMQDIKTSDKYVIEILVSDLAAHGLLGIWEGKPREPKGWSVTDSGLKLMHFLTDLWI